MKTIYLKLDLKSACTKKPVTYINIYVLYSILTKCKIYM